MRKIQNFPGSRDVIMRYYSNGMVGGQSCKKQKDVLPADREDGREKYCPQPLSFLTMQRPANSNENSLDS